MGRKKKEIESAMGNVKIAANIDKPQTIVTKTDWTENAALEEAPSVIKTFSTNIYENAYTPNISIRDGFDRADYDYYRPEEHVPKDSKGKIVACMAAYKESGNGIIKNIVDLIADLVVQGIDVVHQKKKNEKFSKAWFHKVVNGGSVSERFVNLLCRSGNDVIKRDTGKITLKKTRKLYKGEGAVTKMVVEDDPVPVKREIPISYTFLDPRIVDVYQPDLTMFLNNKDVQFVLNIPANIIRAIQYPKNDQEKELVNLVPTDIVESVRKNIKFLPLKKDKIRFHCYKKDDWEVWADPMIYPVLSDLQALKKMKLADLAAVDGVLSQIRVWKLGSMENKVRAGLPAMNRLAKILMNGVAGGILDIIWSDDIECQEIGSNLHQFLGEAKYLPILNAIYTGLGIPPLFAGAKTEGSFTSNFLAIKAFIVRLEYLRDKLREFWSKEFELLQAAMEWDTPPILVFDRMTLNDESSILKIMLDMVDRGILSDEAMQEMVGANPEVEEFRTNREYRERKNGKKQPKASIFHDPDFEKGWIDKFIQGGEIAPSQVGIELEPLKKGEKTPNEAQAGRDAKFKPIGTAGRPQNAKDKVKRKPKVVKPQRGVSQKLISNVIWAHDAQEKIDAYLTPNYLEMLGKKNLRQLTNEEFNNLEKLKLGLLNQIPLGDNVTDTQINNLLKGSVSVPAHISSLISEMLNIYKEQYQKEPTIDVIRRFHCVTIATDKITTDNNGDIVSEV